MKNGKEFNNILDECLERLLVKGETIEQCLASYPEQATELEPLLQTALAAKKTSTIQPRPEFRARARHQFRSALQEMETRRKFRFFGWQPQWATAIAIVLILLLAGGGTVAAASNSMPDGTLYAVKEWTENVRLRLTLSELGKAQLYASFADKRVLEIARMAEEGKPELVRRIADRLDTHLMMLVRLIAAQENRPETMMTPSPARAHRPPEGAGDGPRAKLRAAVVRYAIQHPAALRAALDKAPESAKPALRHAIAISIAGYEKAIEATGE